MCRKICLLVLFSLAGCGRPAIPDDFTVSGQPLEYWLLAQSDSRPEMRARAVRALGNVGPEVPEVIPALTNSLTDSDPAIRGQAALALLRFGPAAEEALPALTKAAEDKDEQVRRAATQAIAKIQEK